MLRIRPLLLLFFSSLSIFSQTPGTPLVTFLTPTTGAGTSTTFTSAYSHTVGGNQLYLLYFLLLPTPNIAQFTAAGSCLVEYNRISNGIRLINDAGDNWLGPLPGVPISPSAQPLANSRCQVNVSGVVVTQAGNTIAVSVPITGISVQGVFGTFLQAQDVNGVWTGMTQFGNWVVPPVLPKPGPAIESIFPLSGSGPSVTYAFNVSHTSGASHLTLLSLLIADKISSPTPCQIVFFGDLAFNLLNADGTQLAGPNLVPGSPDVLSNGRCSITGVGASLITNGNLRSVFVPVTFAATESGGRNVYGIAFDDNNLLTHWVQGAIFNITH